MFKSNYLSVLTAGLVFLLSACSSAEANQSAPVKEAPAEAVEARVEEPKLKWLRQKAR